MIFGINFVEMRAQNSQEFFSKHSERHIRSWILLQIKGLGKNGRWELYRVYRRVLATGVIPMIGFHEKMIGNTENLFYWDDLL